MAGCEPAHIGYGYDWHDAGFRGNMSANCKTNWHAYRPFRTRPWPQEVEMDLVPGEYDAVVNPYCHTVILSEAPIRMTVPR